MRRIVIALVALPLALVACDGDGTPAPSATRITPEPSAASGIAGVCDELNTYVTNVQNALAGAPEDMVATVQETSTEAAQKLEDKAGELDGAAAAAVTAASRAIGKVADWKPDDTQSLDDLIQTSTQAVQSFLTDRC